nr:hypothetical protein [uncultured Gellertiella sp.]
MIIKNRFILLLSAVLLALSLQHLLFTRFLAPKMAAGYRLSQLEVARLPGESDLALVNRMKDEVHARTRHCEPLHNPWSWIERAVLAKAYPEAYQQGSLLRQRFFCGFCHQRAYMLQSVLDDLYIKSSVLGLYGHVVLEVSIDGRNYAADADYGTPLVDLSRGMTLRSDVLAAYSGFSQAIEIADMYASTQDNDYYLGRNGFQRYLYQQQSAVFWSNIIAGLLFLMSLAGLYATRSRDSWVHLVRFRRSPGYVRKQEVAGAETA